MFQCIPSVKRTDYMQTWAFLMHGTCQTSIEDKNHCQIVWSLSLFFSIEIYAPTSHTQKCFFFQVINLKMEGVTVFVK